MQLFCWLLKMEKIGSSGKIFCSDATDEDYEVEFFNVLGFWIFDIFVIEHFDGAWIEYIC